MIVGVDVDNTIIDIMTPWVAACNEEYRTSYTKADMVHWDMKNNVEQGIDIYKYLSDGAGLYGPDTPEEPGALGAVGRLHRCGHSIVYITHNVDNGMHDAKVAWMRAHGFMHFGVLWGTVGSEDKTLLGVDAIIDDKPDTVRQFTSKGRLGVIFTQPWNAGDDFTLRIDGWANFNGDLLDYVWGKTFQRG